MTRSSRRTTSSSHRVLPMSIVARRRTTSAGGEKTAVAKATVVEMEVEKAVVREVEREVGARQLSDSTTVREVEARCRVCRAQYREERSGGHSQTDKQKVRLLAWLVLMEWLVSLRREVVRPLLA